MSKINALKASLGSGYQGAGAGADWLADRVASSIANHRPYDDRDDDRDEESEHFMGMLQDTWASRDPFYRHKVRQRAAETEEDHE